MVTVKREGVLLEKTVLGFESAAVFNPAVYQDGDEVHLFYRAVRRGNFSTIGYCRLQGALQVVERSKVPLIIPQYPYERQGVEDPRIVKVDNSYYLSYTAYDGITALGALAVSEDLRHFDKKGVIVPEVNFRRFSELVQSGMRLNEKYFREHREYAAHGLLTAGLNLWDKNVIFFPARIDGNLVFLHRIRPGIQIVSARNIPDELTTDFWERYLLNFSDHIVMEPKYPHESSYIGAGCPPLLTDEGWLLIYHGVYDGPEGYVYHACAALLDRDNPSREIARLPRPLLSPEEDWEKRGYVNNVVFPTGTAIFGDRLYIYYGAADSRIAVASVNLKDLLQELSASKSFY
ncbi:glycosidase [Parapedobacter defluvii]|uniref:Glycosidase n=1 Tax=Parapedobacter defluvii TaxID=2045106 RepID=A0ABQ1M1J5_9SPHI|nr:pesticidal protein Cry7Aa [Parapedobacter defluvii]GGC33203.1 glycosidase [Parapedobacter defluvii]